MSQDISNKICELRDEQIAVADAHFRYMQLENQIESLQSECKHENAYRYGTYEDTYERRSYEKLVCPDCGTYFESRYRYGKFNYPSKEEYMASQMESVK